MWKCREGKRPKPVVLPQRIRVFDAGVCAVVDFQVLQGALAVEGIGEEGFGGLERILDRANAAGALIDHALCSGSPGTP